jgi:hypothetical protein
MDVDWIHVAHDRVKLCALVNAIMIFPDSIKGSEFLD